VIAESAEPFQISGFLNEIAQFGQLVPGKNGAIVDQLIERVAAIQGRMLGPTDPLYNPWLVPNYYESTERWPEAERTENGYILALESANAPNHPRLSQPLLQLANLLRRQNRLLGDAAAARRALNIQEKTNGRTAKPYSARCCLASCISICKIKRQL
jgi:hypothetical protein